MTVRIGFDVNPSNAGDGRYVASICRGMNPEEFRPVFVEAPLAAGQASAQDPAASIRVTGNPQSRLAHKFAPRPVKLWLGFGRTAKGMARGLKKLDLDILHVQKCGCEEMPIAGRLAGVRRVLGTFHIDSTYDLHQKRGDFGHRLLEVASNWSLGAAIAVSESTKRDWVCRTGIPPERVITIHNGIDTQHFRRQSSRQSARMQLGLPPEACIVGAAGRLDEVKGFEYLIDAVGLLASSHRSLVLAIAGRGPLEASLKNRAAHAGIADRVHFLGFQPDIQPVLDSLDIFAMPSLCETLGYALLEGMATELPAIGTRVGGIPEVIVEGTTGFLAESRNAPALADALRALVADEPLRARMGAAGRGRVVRNFNETDMVRRTLDIYRRMLT